MASIVISGNGAPLSVPVGETVTFTASPSGATSYQWTLLDKPEGSSAVLTTPTAQSTQLTLDIEGTYLVRVVVGGTDIAQAAVAAPFVSSFLGEIRIPAAGETFEADSLRGWARAMQKIAKLAIALEQALPPSGGKVWKEPVVAAADSDIPLSGASPLVIDGVTLNDGDRVLLFGQSDQTQNGIYVVSDDGSGYLLERAEDFNASTPLYEINGTVVVVLRGDTYADKAFILATDDPDIDSTPLVFVNLGAVSTIPITIPSGTVEFFDPGQGEYKQLRWVYDDGSGEQTYAVELAPPDPPLDAPLYTISFDNGW